MMNNFYIAALCFVLTTSTISPAHAGTYNYSNVIHDSLLFYEAQRSGKLPANNRVPWRGDSMLTDGSDVGHDLTGGYFDAGDLVKFGFPMAYTITVLSWGAIDYADAYTKASELQNVQNAIRWGTDYFIKCHTSDTEFYGQVGNGGIDHAQWVRPEDWPTTGQPRPSYKVTSAHGGSELTGETAAALAAASIVFKTVDPTYSAKLLNHSQSLYQFANKYRSAYTTEITDAANYYNPGPFGDELAWAATWLLRATNNSQYLTALNNHFQEFNTQLTGTPSQFSWDDKTAGVQVLAGAVTGDPKYKPLVQAFCNYVVNSVPRTPKGLAYFSQWGSLRYAANAAFICLQAANQGINQQTYINFAKSQIGYILGDTGRSFVVGFGTNPPQQPHHAAASCPNPPATCGWSVYNNAGPNPHVLTGALVGGPDQTDTYADERSDYVKNEVADDYNAAFTGALAALLHFNA